MSEPLWSEERISKEIGNRFYTDGVDVRYLIEIGRLVEHVRDEYEDRIAELEAKLSTMSELEEQHLREIDSLERQLRDTQIGVRKLVGLQP